MMDTSKLVVGQRVWMQSGNLFKEATVTEITEEYIDVEPDPVGNEYRYFRRFDKTGKKDLGGNGGPDAWDPRPMSGDGWEPWELVER